MAFENDTFIVPVSPESVEVGLSRRDVFRRYTENFVCIKSPAVGSGSAFSYRMVVAIGVVSG